MQTYLPFIKALLSEWYILTLNNALYATALAAAVWLLTATLYSIRIVAIKRAKAASEKTGLKNLNAVQQQLQQSQEELAETALQMEKAQRAAQDETQRAFTLEQLIYQRNQQIAGIIQTLATSFDLGERPLLASEDVKADLLWQQHDKVITQLIERLRTELQAKIELQQTCQAETAKLAEKEVLLEALQTTIATHSAQLSKLEQALEEQKAMLQQQNNVQQALSETLRKYQAAASRPAPEPEPIKTVETWQQPEESPAIIAPAMVQPVQDNRIEPIVEEPQTAVTLPAEDTSVELVAPLEAVATFETVAPSEIEPEPQPIDEQAPLSVSLDSEQQPVAPAKGSLGKIKNLFGKKQASVKTEPQWTAAKSDQALPSDSEHQPDNSQKAPGKLKGLYGKFRSKDK